MSLIIYFFTSLFKLGDLQTRGKIYKSYLLTLKHTELETPVCKKCETHFIVEGNISSPVPTGCFIIILCIFDEAINI